MEKNQHTVFEENLFLEVVIFYKTVTNYLNDSLQKNSQLGIYEIFFLIFLEGLEEGTTCYELSKRFPFDKSYINKVIKRLEEKGMIIKTRDGKKKLITLSKKSRSMLTEKIEVKNNFIELLDKNNITDEELNDFVKLLKKLAKILDKDKNYE